jgi:hypothetical protein
MNVISVKMPKPSLAQKLAAALYISSCDAVSVGIGTKAGLMWPELRFTDHEARQESARLIGDVLMTLLSSTEKEKLNEIERRQKNYLEDFLCHHQVGDQKGQQLGEEPSIEERLASAHLILAVGVLNVGVAAKDCLMWPSNNLTDHAVLFEARRLTSEVSVSLLSLLSQDKINQILRK